MVRPGMPRRLGRIERLEERLVLTIVIEVQTIPDGDPTQFNFFGDVGGLLRDGETASADVGVGFYESTEQVPPGWTLTSIVCDDDNSSGDGPTAFFQVDFENPNDDVGPSETVTCTFTNTKDTGTIIVEKQTFPEGDPAEFFFTGDLSGSLSDNETLTLEVSPGFYESTEIVPR